MKIILVVDHEPWVSGLVKAVLEIDLGADRSIQIQEIHEADEAIAAVEVLDPVVMILDVLMPGDGFRVLERCAKRVPVVVLSARANDPEIAQRCRTMGAFSVVAKPFVQARLVELVRAIIANRDDHQSRGRA